MKKTLIYDLPTRLFHWSFAALFVAAYFITNVFEDESSAFPYHMMIGLLMALIIFLRIIWGIVGTKYARFSSYVLSPTALIEYFKGIFSKNSKRKLGRNPASSWAALLMIAISIGLAVTGYLITTPSKTELLEEIHELLSDGFLIIVLLHIAGVILHTIRHKDPIAKSMVTGYKDPINESSVGIKNNSNIVALFFIIAVIAFVSLMANGYDPKERTLDLPGFQIKLEEMEKDKNGYANEYNREKEYNDDD
jgi:cytochrome b